MDSCLDQLIWLYKRKNEGIYWHVLFGQKDATKAIWMPNESESSASLPPRKYTEDYSIIKLLPSIMRRIPGLAHHGQNSSSSSSLSSSSCFPLLSLESPPTLR